MKKSELDKIKRIGEAQTGPQGYLFMTPKTVEQLVKDGYVEQAAHIVNPSNSAEVATALTAAKGFPEYQKLIAGTVPATAANTGAAPAGATVQSAADFQIKLETGFSPAEAKRFGRKGDPDSKNGRIRDTLNRMEIGQSFFLAPDAGKTARDYGKNVASIVSFVQRSHGYVYGTRLDRSGNVVERIQPTRVFVIRYVTEGNPPVEGLRIYRDPDAVKPAEPPVAQPKTVTQAPAAAPAAFPAPAPQPFPDQSAGFPAPAPAPALAPAGFGGAPAFGGAPSGAPAPDWTVAPE